MERMGTFLESSHQCQRHIFSVSELSNAIKDILEGEFPLVWVKGQVSNFTKASSGHIYFTLKDELSSIPCVWFRSYHNIYNKNESLLYEGQEIICAGRISIYPPRGCYQIIVELVQDIGLGKLFIELEQLKKKLMDKGYFDPSIKKSIPKNPIKVAVITSVEGAAIRDFLKIAKEKKMPAHIRIYPSTVQGIEAENKIVEMMDLINRDMWAEVIVLIRGGGSIEDLYVFNSEKIAHSIFKSQIPVVTGIGHEIDYTIADMVADFRCATPTHVANYLWDDSSFYMQQIDELSINLTKFIKDFFESISSEIVNYISQLRAYNPYNQLIFKEEAIYDYLNRMNLLVKNILLNRDQQIDEAIKIATIIIDNMLTNIHQSTQSFIENMKSGIIDLLHEKKRALDVIETELASLDPLGPLKKGYALVKDKENIIVKNSVEAKARDKLEIVFSDGSVNVLVEK